MTSSTPRGRVGEEPLAARGVLTLVKALLLFESVLYSAITPLLPHYARALGASKPAIGVLAASYTAGLIPGAVLGSWMAARAGVRRTTLIGLVAFAAATVAFGFAGTLPALDSLRASQGIACGLIWGGALTWVIAASPSSRRGEVLGSVMAAAIFGTLLGPLLGILAAAAGTKLIFALVGIVALGLATRVLAQAEPARPPARKRPPARSLLSNRALMLGAGLMMLGAATIGATGTLIPLRMARLGASSLAIGATFLVASAISTLVAPVAGRVSDRRGLALPMAVGLPASAVLLALIPLAGSAPVLAGFSVLALGAPLTAWMIPASSLITRAGERAGIPLALTTMVFNLAYALGETVGAPAAAGLAQASTDAIPYFLLATLMLAAMKPVLCRTSAAALSRAATALAG